MVSVHVFFLFFFFLADFMRTCVIRMDGHFACLLNQTSPPGYSRDDFLNKSIQRRKIAKDRVIQDSRTSPGNWTSVERMD